VFNNLQSQGFEDHIHRFMIPVSYWFCTQILEDESTEFSIREKCGLVFEIHNTSIDILIV